MGQANALFSIFGVSTSFQNDRDRKKVCRIFIEVSKYVILYVERIYLICTWLKLLHINFFDAFLYHYINPIPLVFEKNVAVSYDFVNTLDWGVRHVVIKLLRYKFFVECSTMMLSQSLTRMYLYLEFIKK